MSTVGDTVASGGFRVPSLTGKDNYKTWKINMVDILSDMDLLNHIEKKPEELHAADAAAAIKTKILKMDQKTLGQIRLRCTPFAGVYIEDSILAKEKDAWETLQSEFQDSGALFLYINCMHPKCRKGRIWIFISRKLVAFTRISGSLVMASWNPNSSCYYSVHSHHLGKPSLLQLISLLSIMMMKRLKIKLWLLF